LARERRKFLTARIASGEWDGIIMTHSSFERIGMSRDYQAGFWRADQGIRRPADRHGPLLHRQAAPKHHQNDRETESEARGASQRTLAEKKKDDGLVFDELGVDHVFIDEAHYFKNLETPTKMDRVAGIQTGGSERAFDLFMKARSLDERHPARRHLCHRHARFPNTMVEMYTMQRFLDPEGLKSRGIEHFDAWLPPLAR